MEDILLVRRCKEGDKIAFKELVDRYKERIYSVAYRMTNNHTDADDLSQETFIRTYKSIKKFNEKSTFYTWLYRIVVNVSLNYLKSPGHTRETVSLDENIMSPNPEDNIKDNPRDALDEKELRHKVMEAIQSLPPIQKIVVVLVILQGLSYKEVAEIQTCSEGTVAWRLHQARENLKKRLKGFLG